MCLMVTVFTPSEAAAPQQCPLLPQAPSPGVSSASSLGRETEGEAQSPGFNLVGAGQPCSLNCAALALAVGSHSGPPSGRACSLRAAWVGEVTWPQHPGGLSRPSQKRFGLVPALSVSLACGGRRPRRKARRLPEETWLRAPLWYIYHLSFFHPCGVWDWSLLVTGTHV